MLHLRNYKALTERAFGMDVHKDSITACTMTPEGKEIQTFSTKTIFLLQLIDWIKKHVFLVIKGGYLENTLHHLNIWQ